MIVFNTEFSQKNTTTLANKSFEAVKDSISNKKMAKEERDSYTANLWRPSGNFAVATKERGITIQKVTMAALIQIATKQGHSEKKAMKKLEAEENQEEAESNAVLEVSQGDHQPREAPICEGEACKVHVALGITAQCRNWNQQSDLFAIAVAHVQQKYKL